MPTFELRGLDSYDNDSLLDELRRVATIVTTPVLTRSAFRQHSKVSATVIWTRFGSWHRALELAGLQERGSDIRVHKRVLIRGFKTFTDDELLDNLRSVAQLLGVTSVTIKQFNCHGVMNAATIIKRFGSWRQAVERAGLTLSNLGKRHSASEYFENLLVVWTHYGRQPMYGEMDRVPSKIRAGAYVNKWSGWRNALRAFISQVNSDIAETKQNHETASNQEQLKADPPQTVPTASPSTHNRHASRKRNLTLGLRYDVFRRDHFRCVICGASPASLFGCELHVDHIFAFARGGDNAMDNLRTLCKNCNVGKAMKVECASTANPAVDTDAAR